MFTASFFDNPIILLQGAFVGFIFGFLLQKGNVANFDTIIGQFILKDFTVLKIIFSAILVGSFGADAESEAGGAGYDEFLDKR